MHPQLTVLQNEIDDLTTRINTIEQSEGFQSTLRHACDEHQKALKTAYDAWQEEVRKSNAVQEVDFGQ